MNLKAKVNVENQKKAVLAELSVRVAFLKEKGFKDDVIKKDVAVRKLKAGVRKAAFRLASIASQEKLNQDRAQAKIDKLAAGKVAKEARKKKVKGDAPDKKEKKGKKEKSEKQAKSEGKKEKPEKKTEPTEAQ